MRNFVLTLAVACLPGAASLAAAAPASLGTGATPPAATAVPRPPRSVKTKPTIGNVRYGPHERQVFDFY